MIRNKLLTPIVVFIISLFLIIIGAVLSISIIFLYIGLPLLVIGILLLVTSIFLFISGVLGGFTSLFRRTPRQKVESNSNIKQDRLKERRKGKIIDVSDDGGVYRAK